MDPSVTVAALGEVLAPERAEKIDRVAAARLGGVVVVLENLHDPHNGAAVLRSAEAIGLREVRVVGTRLRFSERITQGCDKWLDVHYDETMERCAAELRGRGFALYAAVPGAKRRLDDLDVLRPAAFLMGNEHAGLTDRARALADVEFSIPLEGFSQSLNLSVATAVVLFTHASRRRAALGRSGDLDAETGLALRADYYARDVRGAEAIVARYRARDEPR